MIDPRFAIAGAVLPLLGNLRHAQATLSGRTRPNRVSWALWALLPLIAFAAELSAGVGLASLVTLSLGLGPLLVLAASLGRRAGFAALERWDIWCAACALLAVVVWALSGRGYLAVGASVLGDAFAALPTIRKAYRAPQSESASAFIASSLGSLLTLFTLRRWTVDSAAFPAWVVLGGGLIGLLTVRASLRRLIGSAAGRL